MGRVGNRAQRRQCGVRSPGEDDPHQRPRPKVACGLTLTVGVASEMMGVGIKGAGWTMTLGILVIISAFLVLFNPIIGVGVVVFWVGLSLLLAGVDLIAHAVTLRRLRKEL